MTQVTSRGAASSDFGNLWDRVRRSGFAAGTCDTIHHTPRGFPMARGGFNGFGSVGSAFQFRCHERAAGHFVTQPVQPAVRPHKTLLLLLNMFLLACWLAPYAVAQNDDVH